MGSGKKIIVIGAGIAGLTAAYTLQKKGFEVEVLESSSRTGGRMTTDITDGCIIDRGAQFLSSAYPVIMDLIHETGLSDRLVETTPWVAVVRNGILHRVNFHKPMSPVSDGLLGWGEWMKFMAGSMKMYPTVHKLPINNYSAWAHLDTETADQWYNREMGIWMTDYIIEPMLEGFYFQSPKVTSKALTMAMGAFSLHKAKTMTLKGGMGILPETLAKTLNIRLNTRVRKLDVPTNGVTVHTDQADIHADQVILTCPAPVSKGLFSNPGYLEKQLMDTTYSSTLTVSVTTDPSWTPPVLLEDVYGILVPGKERRVIAAISNETNKCRDRITSGLLFNIMPDGASGARMLSMNDDEVACEIYPELERFIPGMTGAVTSISVHRWKNAEPASPVGRSRLIDAYRKASVADYRILLAGDYMGMPFTEGAAESGLWAANQVAGVAGDCFR